MTDSGQLLQQVQFWLAIAALALAAVGVGLSVVSIVRRRQGPFLTEFVTVAMSTGVSLWVLKLLVPPGEERASLANVSMAGFVLFLLSCAARIALHRRGGAESRPPAGAGR
jgi:hypothetical protein